MFARASTAVHVCLKCQQRLVRIQNTLQRCDSTPIPRSASVTKRWQSQAAAQIEEAEEDELDKKRELRQSIFGDHGADHQTVEHERDWSRRNKLTKHFHLASYQDLGVHVLGKPAGIILLPETNRPVPEAPDVSDVEPIDDVHETLQSESQPITWEDVKQRITNIPRLLFHDLDTLFGETVGSDAIGEDHVPGQRKLDEQQWEDLRLNLYSGFTSKQLKRYLEESNVSPTVDLNSAKTSKNYVVRAIAKDIWGYQLPIHISDEKPFRHVEVAMNDSLNTLEILLMRSDQPFRKIANDHHVQIDVFRARGCIRISGPQEKVGPAKKEVFLLKQSIRRHRYMMNGKEREYFNGLTSEARQSFLQKMGNKYGITANWDEKQNLEIIYSSQKPEVIDNVRRDAILAARNVDVQEEVFSWPPDLSTTSLLPFSISNSARSDKALQWIRVTSTHSTGISNSFRATVSKADKPALKEQATSLAQALLQKPPSASKSIQVPRQEISARFGQALFDRSLHQSSSPSPKSLLQSRPRIATQIPLLPQILAHLQNQSDQSSDERAALEFLRPERSFEMRLAPCSADSTSPWIHVRLRGTQKSYSGLDQPLEVTRVMAVSEEKRSVFLLPSTPVDIIFSSKFTRDLFVPGMKHLNKDTAKLLQGLAHYMNPEKKSLETSDSKNVSRRKFRPFVKLPVPSILNDMSSIAISKIPSKPNTKSLRAKSNSNTIANSLEEYVLMSVDPLDTSTFPLSQDSQFSLEHVIYPNSVTANTNAQSQNLRLIYTQPQESDPSHTTTSISSTTTPTKDKKNKSISSISSSKTKSDEKQSKIQTPTDFLKFFDCALEVANQIGLVGQNYTKTLGSPSSP